MHQVVYMLDRWTWLSFFNCDRAGLFASLGALRV